MKVLFITGIFPPDIGGPATYVPVMARALSERGHRVSVLTTSEPHDMEHDDGGFPFPVVRVNRRLSLCRRTVDLIRQVIRLGRDANVIYANGMHFEAVLANKFIRKPLVMKIVGDEAWERATRKSWTTDGFEDFQNKRQNWPAELNKRLRSWVTRRADRVIVPSEYLKRFVTGWGVDKKRCVVIYNAAQYEEDQNASPANNKTVEETTRLITVGRLIPLRNLPLILKAVEHLPQTVLTIVGDGPCFRDWSDETNRLNLQERVHFVGSQKHEVVRELLRQHDVFVLASSHEGFPHSILEAMAEGLAVVATDVGGTPEIIEDGINGLLVPPNDGQVLQEALKLLVEDVNLRSVLAIKGKVTVETKFGIKVMVDKTEAALREAAGIKKRTCAHLGGNLVEKNNAVDPELLKIICCPRCHGDLILAEDGQGLDCLDCLDCRLRYPIEDGIPIMLVERSILLSERRL